MIHHPGISVLMVCSHGDSCFHSFGLFLQTLPRVRLTRRSRTPGDVSGFDVVISRNADFSPKDQECMERFVRSGGGWLEMVDGSDQPLSPIFGTRPARKGPDAELRVLFQDPKHPLGARLTDALYLQGHYQALETVAEDAEVLLYADWHYRRSPVLVLRNFGKGRTACSTLQACDHPLFQRILYRLLGRLAGQTLGEKPLGVGLLGYAPSVGKFHGKGVETTPGLVLKSICDVSPQRLETARGDFPGLKTCGTKGDLAGDPSVDLVVIATPPNSHSSLAIEMMEAGKHVVCEKPLALTRKETETMRETAEVQKLHLSCHQNRRFDVDYLAIKQAIDDGLIGDLFYMETFVGDFKHPCGYWHSHTEVSGGTAYDWGSHHLDWIVSLIPDRVVSVVGSRQKRVWHDVTNADQERVQMRFAGGQEADFIHSNIAGARKPKWYLLGTRGGIVGNWRDVVAYEMDPLHYFRSTDIPATEMIPDLTLYRRHHSGSIVPQRMATPDRQPFAFHRNLADHLLLGEPLAAPLDQSVTVVAILEAAARSAERNGAKEMIDG